eukprot:5819947-Prymnesium_polylepis.1
MARGGDDRRRDVGASCSRPQPRLAAKVGDEGPDESGSSPSRRATIEPTECHVRFGGDRVTLVPNREQVQQAMRDAEPGAGRQEHTDLTRALDLYDAEMAGAGAVDGCCGKPPRGGPGCW